MYKDIKGYQGRYQVDENGNVWSCVSGRKLHPTLRKTGYYEVCLVDSEGKRHYERVHRLVALMFVQKPEGCNVVNHLDCNKQNNHFSNLQWTTVKGNTNQALEHGLGVDNQRKATQAARLVVAKRVQVYYKDELVGRALGYVKAAQLAHCNQKTVRNCLKANRKSRSGYSFKIVEGGWQDALDKLTDKPQNIQ